MDYDCVCIERAISHEVFFIKIEPLLVSIEHNWDLHPYQCDIITWCWEFSPLFQKTSLKCARRNAEISISNHMRNLPNGSSYVNMKGSPPMLS